MKEEALDRTMWKNRFGRGFGPVVLQITDDDEDNLLKPTLKSLHKRQTNYMTCKLV